MSYVSEQLEHLKKLNSNEPEFIQAATEVLTTLEPVIEANPQYEAAGILERLTEPERQIMFRVPWVDDKGNALPDDTRVKVDTTYKWRFTPTDTNYTTLTGEIELLHHKSNGGGSSGYSYYTIEATAGAGGSISPSGNVSVREGRDQTFTITPDKGYAVSNVKIDGKSIGAVKSYTFENVSRTHTIEVVFVKGTASARTGDSSDLPLWSALLLASTLTLAGAVHYKRKRAR